MKKRFSLTVKLIGIMTALVAGIVFLCWILNSLFLEEFYKYEKKNDLQEAFFVLGNAYEQETIYDEEFDVPFEKMCSKGNLDILIVDAQSKVIRSSTQDVQGMLRLLQEMMTFGGEIRKEVPPKPFPDNKFDGQYQAVIDIIEKNGSFMIYRQRDERLGAEYMVLWGNIGEDAHVYIRTALESIHESAAITNRFYMVVGLFGIVVGVIMIFFVAKGTTRPIKELTAISRAMSELRFEVKYESGAQDSSELAELGEHMNRMSTALEKTISDLKAANNELKQDIAQKERIDEMRKEFLSNVSHELKTPLALIRGYAEGLKDEILEDGESREYYCEVIIDETNKMNHMVKQLLTLNHLEFGNDPVEMTRFNICDMISGLVQANQILADQNGVTLEFTGGEECYVWGDEFKTEEVLTNYISNALHHVSGEKRISISLEQKERVCRICVFNTGNPIPEGELDKIWEKFYKVDKARTREYGGSGVGLSIVKAIMESMHQAYGVRNLTNGVEFYLELENSCIND